MDVGRKPGGAVGNADSSRFTGRCAKLFLLALAVIAVASLLFLRGERTSITDGSAGSAARKGDPSLALALFQRRAPTATLATGFQGRVADTRGTPVAQALICASCANCEPSHAPPSACTRSDERGDYALSQLAAGRHYLSAVANGHLPLTAYDGEPTLLQANELRKGVDFVLTAGGATVAGHVLDATGGPIALAKVRALRLMPPRLSIDVVSDENGRFELALVPGPFQLIAEADGYAPASRNLDAPHRDVSLLLTPESSLRGTVVSALDGHGVADVEVRALAAHSPGLAIFRSAVSDAQGAFSLRGLEPGTYLLVAKGERWQERVSEGVELGVAARVDDVRIEVEPAAALSGRVSSSDGNEPCRSGFVNLKPTRARDPAAGPAPALLSASVTRGAAQMSIIQADGSVFFPGVAAGAYTVDVRCIGYSLADGPRSLEVGTEPIEDLSWKVSAGISLTVTVTDRGGRAAPGAAFDLRYPGPNGRTHIMPLATGPDGRMKIPGLAPGKYTLATRGGEDVPVELSQREREMKVTLVQPAGGSIALSVVTDQNVPVDGVNVSVQKLADDATAMATAVPTGTTRQGDGIYQIGPLAQGHYVLRVTDEANPPVELGRDGQRIQVSDGAVTRARAVLKRAGKIEGQVVDERGGPVANVWVSAQSESQRSRLEEISLMRTPTRVLTDLEGEFVLPHLAEDGHYVLRVEEPSGAVAQKIGVRPGERIMLTLPSSAAISGEVVAANGRPMQRYTLRATQLETGATREATVVSATGSFALSGVTPGTVEVEITGESGAFVQSTLQLLPGKRVDGLKLAERQAAATTTRTSPGPDPTPSTEPRHGNGT